MLNAFELRNDQLNIGQKSFRVMVVQDVHINSLAAAGEKGVDVLLMIDAAPDCCYD